MHGRQMIGSVWTHRKSRGRYVVIGDIKTSPGLPWIDDSLGLFYMIDNDGETLPYFRPIAIPVDVPAGATAQFVMYVTVQFDKELPIDRSGALCWVLYQSVSDFRVFARQKDEFLDGRFDELTTSAD